MKDKARKYLLDVRRACELVAQFVAGKSLAEYSRDPLVKSAVERQFEIIGEALNRLLRAESELENSVTAAKRVIAFRNYLIHGYSDISDDIVWGIIESNLPILRQEVERILSSR
jgi:uncharacterized protein with HEPN domain